MKEFDKNRQVTFNAQNKRCSLEEIISKTAYNGKKLKRGFAFSLEDLESICKKYSASAINCHFRFFCFSAALTTTQLRIYLRKQ